MFDRLRNLWELLKSALWFMPAVMAAGAMALALLTTALDVRIGRQLHEQAGWLWAGGADGARALLSTVAGSMVTVAGVTFSVTVVALSVAVAQFGSLLLRNFMRDRGNQFVLGTFIATFIYCLLVLGMVDDVGRPRGLIPYLSVTVGVVLAISSLGVFIYFVHHISQSLQTENLTQRLAGEVVLAIGRIFPEKLGEDGPQGEEEPRALRQMKRGVPAVINARNSGYLQAVANDSLMAIAARRAVCVRLLNQPGDFVIEGSGLVQVWPKASVDEEMTQELQHAFVIGRERTPTQDVRYAVRQLVEIAVRALSPGINDPYAAVTCIDWLAVGLHELAQREIPSIYRYDDQGKLRVIAPATDFSALADVSLNQIRQYGAQSVTVLLRMLERLADVGQKVRREGDRDALRRHAQLIEQDARRLPNPHDREAIAAVYQRAMRALALGARRTHDRAGDEQPDRD